MSSNQEKDPHKEEGKKSFRPTKWIAVVVFLFLLATGLYLFVFTNDKKSDELNEKEKVTTTNPQTLPNFWNEYCDLKAPGDSRIFENPDPDHYHIHTFGYGKKYDYVAGNGSTKTAGGSSLSTEEADYITLTYTSEPCRIRVLFQKNGTCEYCKN